MTPQKKLHFISIGGSVMHALALALKQNGHIVTGSDDEIFEPAKSNLHKEGLHPDSEGWNPDRITTDIDTVILGMHATSDNPEVLRAQELSIPIMSFPEYVYSISQNKQRIVIGGSHGKTTITSMIIHVLNYFDKEFDFLVGAHIDGFETMAKFSDAPIVVLEGDEYPSSKLDMKPQIPELSTSYRINFWYCLGSYKYFSH